MTANASTIGYRDLAGRVSVLAAIRYPLDLPLFLKFLIVPLAFHHMLGGRMERFVFWAAPFLVYGNVAAIGANTPFLDILRLNFAFAFVFYASYVASLGRDVLIRSIVMILVPAALAVAALELVLGPGGERAVADIMPLPGLSWLSGLDMLPRLNGLHGGSNYSGALYGLLALVLIYSGRRVAGLAMVAVMLLCVSRAATLAFLFAVIAYHSPRIVRRAAVIGAFLVVLLMPVVLWVAEPLLDPMQRAVLATATTLRYINWLNFIEMGLDHPFFGVGYFQGKEEIPAQTLMSWQVLLQRRIPEYEAHHLVLDVFGELGAVFTALFLSFYARVAHDALQRGPLACAVYVFVSLAYLTLSGISDWTFWFAIGFIYALPVAATPPSPAPVPTGGGAGAEARAAPGG